MREKAAAILQGPELPESVGYLRDWLYQLHGTSGVAMDGAAPLSWSTIRDWASFVGIDPPPTEDEVSALRMLDALLRSESRPKQPPDAPVADAPKRRGAR